MNFSGAKEEFDKIINTADSINCACKKEWTERIESAPTSTLSERVAAGAQMLSEKYVTKKFAPIKFKNE